MPGIVLDMLNVFKKGTLLFFTHRESETKKLIPQDNMAKQWVQHQNAGRQNAPHVLPTPT